MPLPNDSLGAIAYKQCVSAEEKAGEVARGQGDVGAVAAGGEGVRGAIGRAVR